MKSEFSQQIFRKVSNTKFHENLYSWNRVGTKLTVVFHNFANAPIKTRTVGNRSEAIPIQA
jgi:hypothetical protein